MNLSPSRRSGRDQRFVLLFATNLLGVMLLVTGCRGLGSPDLESGPPSAASETEVSESGTSWLDQFRSFDAQAGERGTGVSSRARSIEENLGYRH